MVWVCQWVILGQQWLSPGPGKTDTGRTALLMEIRMAEKRERLEIRAAAQEYAQLALKTLVNVLRTGETDRDRVTAAKEILDRAYGKPVQSHKIDETPTDPTQTEEMLDRAERFTSAIAGLAGRAGKAKAPK